MLWPGVALAQPIFPRLPPIQTSSEALKPGSWVNYSIVLRKSGRKMTLRLAALQKEDDAQWFEMSVHYPSGQGLILKTLLKGSLSTFHKPLKTVLQILGQQAFYLPPGAGSAQLPSFQSPKDFKARRVTKGKLKVPAGIFSVEKYHRVEKGRVTQIWLSQELPGWPMIKLLSPSLHLELLAHGTAAKSQIKGQPVEISGDDLTGF